MAMCLCLISVWQNLNHSSDVVTKANYAENLCFFPVVHLGISKIKKKPQTNNQKMSDKVM